MPSIRNEIDEYLKLMEAQKANYRKQGNAMGMNMVEYGVKALTDFKNYLIHKYNIGDVKK